MFLLIAIFKCWDNHTAKHAGCFTEHATALLKPFLFYETSEMNVANLISAVSVVYFDQHQSFYIYIYIYIYKIIIIIQTAN